MGSIGDFLLWTPIILCFTLLVVVFATNFGFVIEAQERGFTANQTSTHFNSKGCFVNGTSEFCKSDYGLLGIRTWLDQKDQNAVYSLFGQGENQIPQNICKERVIDYNLTKTNDSYSLQVKCNN